MSQTSAYPHRVFANIVVVHLCCSFVACSDHDVARSLASMNVNPEAANIHRHKDLPPIVPVEVTSINIAPTNFTITQIGESLQLQVNAELSNGKSFSKIETYSWESADESIVTVKNGLLTATGEGTTTITTALEGFSKSLTVKVDNSGRSINGLVRYEDREYNRDGLELFPQTPNFKAVRYAAMDLLDENDSIIISSETSRQGRFDFGKLILENYTVRVLALIENDIAPDFSVQSLGEEIYAVSQIGDSGSLAHDIQISANSSIAGAFNILDVMLTAADFSQQILNTRVSNLQIFWEEGSEVGTYYCTGFDIGCENGEGIYVYSQHQFTFGGSEADFDEYDDDVLMHEYGHFLVENFAQDDSPGGCHNLTDNNLDLRLAWSEGLGTFFPIAIKNWLKETNPNLMSMSSNEPVTLYVDTMRTRTNPSEAFINFDIANFDDPDPITSPDTAEVYYYASSEVAILKILWEISLEYGVERIWDIVANYFNQAEYPSSLATFWDGFTNNSEFAESDLQILQGIFNERQVFYQNDDFEIDDLDNPVEINLSTMPQTDHTLYRMFDELDKDIFIFDAIATTPYTIKTQNLRNGIDTKIRVLDALGNLVIINGVAQENDDTNPDSYLRKDPACFGGLERIYVDKTSLASSLVFTPQESAPYYIEVSHHSKFRRDANFTGHYGSYDLSIIQK